MQTMNIKEFFRIFSNMEFSILITTLLICILAYLKFSKGYLYTAAIVGIIKIISDYVN
jgi:hypothetical protein